MPKGLNIKGFGRRKSSGNALDFDEPQAAAAPPSAPGQSSFRVIERPDKKISTYGAPGNIRNSPLHALRGKSADDLGLGQNRGSAGTTNSGSSGYYDSSSASARHSSTSTLPSSVEQDRDEELFAPVRKSQTTGMYRSVAADADSPPLPPPPSFTTRAARALSFGNKNNSNKGSRQDIPPLPPAHAATNGTPMHAQRSQSPYRERAMTTSSYASTAVPSKADLHLSVDGLGTDDDFGSMFDSLKKDNPPMPPPTASGFPNRTDSQPMFPPRTYSRQALSSSPNTLKLAQSRREDNESPYYSDGRDSNDALVPNSSALSSPNTTDGSPPGPAVGNGITQAFLGNSQSGYSRVPERYTSPGPERASIESYSSVMDDGVKGKEPEFPSRQTHVDDEERWVRRVELHDPQGSSSPGSVRAKPAPSQRQQLNTSYATAGASRPGAVSPKSATDSSVYAESNNTTPRAARSELKAMPEHTMIDSSPSGPPSAAIRPGAHQRTESGGMKKMTKAQFQALQRRGQPSEEQSDEEDHSGDDYDDDDDVERAKKMATQRRKQEANMSVYRQQMKKVTGGGPTDLPSSAASTIRPSMDRGASAPAASGVLHFGGISGTPPADTVRGKLDEDEDDDVPLGILQAHGFPTGSRPPTRVGENDINHQRRTSVAGSVMNGGAGQGNLPPFARRLPADPYFGAGLVNQSTRESLAMNSTAGSVMGMPTTPGAQMAQQAPPSMGHPGGLVGVIAGEERARAARRGSPNMATGTYNNPMGGPMPLPGNMSMAPPMPRTMSMGNLAPPLMYGGAPPMPPMPQMMPQMQQPALDPGQQQMQQFMQMQMQLMQNMINMQQQQMGQPVQTPTQPPQQANDYLGVNFGNASRPMSMASNHSNFQPHPTNQGRSMTMMNPPPSWNQAPPAGGPRPNSAMPMSGSSYAPSTSGALGGLNLNGGGPGPGYTPSIAPSERSNIGMPSRYRPVTQMGDGSRSQSMTSSMTLQAFTNQQNSPNLAGTTFNGQQAQATTPKPTIRIVDKPKGAPKTAAPRAAAEDEDDGWAAMRKKREDKKKSKWGKKSSTVEPALSDPSLNDLYRGLE